MDSYNNIYIEIEKHSNMKYEFNKNTNKLELDRILPYPYFYPYAYGFFKNTIGNDGDELDALLITNEKYSNFLVVIDYIQDWKNKSKEMLEFYDEKQKKPSKF